MQPIIFNEDQVEKIRCQIISMGESANSEPLEQLTICLRYMALIRRALALHFTEESAARITGVLRYAVKSLEHRQNTLRMENWALYD